MTDPLTPLSRALHDEISARRGPSRRGKPTQEEIAEAINRTQPYVSSRITGKEPWTTTDIDNFAPLFRETAFSLIAAARKRLELENVSMAHERRDGANATHKDGTSSNLVVKTKVRRDTQVKRVKSAHDDLMDHFG
ncbi:hypothetical protein [Leifsonia xyli]|uniref:hypothetical protein n=1 Tax=Leifsonia xyli TaxID=1575 RepID=UPI0011869328|nr:hypothetical protein [Leifsonia xyli]